MNKIISACLILNSLLFLNIFHSNSQTVLTLQPGTEAGIDASITSIGPDFNFGNIPNFYASAWTFGGEFGIQRSLLKFNLEQIPSSAIIINASLSLYYYQGSLPGHAGENASYLQKVLENWDETTVTWNTQPTITTFNEVYLPASTNQTQDYTDIDITPFVSDWIADPQNNFGMLFRLAYDTIYTSMLFASSDNPTASLRPKLVITYRLCPHPVADFSYIVQEPDVQFYDSSSPATTWLWDFGDGYFSDLKNPVHHYPEFGKYYTCLTITDSCGSDEYCDSIMYQPNGIELLNGEGFTLYPNPAQDHLNIAWISPQPGSGEIHILNSQGMIIFKRPIMVTSNVFNDDIDVTGFSPGFYYLRILTNDFAVFKRFVVI